MAAGDATGWIRAGCWAPNHAGRRPGRRRDWQGVRAALERLADHHRHRDDRHRPQERAGRLRSRDLGRQERDGR